MGESAGLSSAVGSAYLARHPVLNTKADQLMVIDALLALGPTERGAPQSRAKLERARSIVKDGVRNQDLVDAILAFQKSRAGLIPEGMPTTGSVNVLDTARKAARRRTISGFHLVRLLHPERRPMVLRVP